MDFPFIEHQMFVKENRSVYSGATGSAARFARGLMTLKCNQYRQKICGTTCE